MSNVSLACHLQKRDVAQVTPSALSLKDMANLSFSELFSRK
jgi:hypothetical protein